MTPDLFSAATRRPTPEEAFARTYPQAWEWITRKADTFEFASSMRLALRKHGTLTQAQHAAIDRCIAKDAARAYDRAIRAETAAIMDMSRIVEAFDAVKKNGAKKASLRLHGLTISMAPATGRNPNCLYVKRAPGGEYIGKIDPAGIYRPSFSSTPADLDLLRAANVDPRAAAIRYARETGECSCCGRELTDPESIALGIGPICAARWNI